MKNPNIHYLLFFDGICLFCQGWIAFLYKNDAKKQLYFAPLQGKTAQIYLQEVLGEKYLDLKSFYLYKKGKIYQKSTAFFELCKILGGFFYLFLIFYPVPSFLLDKIYDFVAQRRYLWKSKTCLLPNTPRFLD